MTEPEPEPAPASAPLLSPEREHAVTTVQALAAFESAAGGRGELAGILEAAPGAEFELLAGLLADPANDRTSLAALCRRVGLSVRDFFLALRDARYSRMYAEIGLRVAAGLPAVAEDVVARAVPHWITCAECGGSGEQPRAPGDAGGPAGTANAAEALPGPLTEIGSPTPSAASHTPPAAQCLVCKGRGQSFVLPELSRQKLALELGGVLRPGGGVQVGVQVGVIAGGGGGIAGTSPAFRGRTDQMLWEGEAESRSAVVEAQVVDEHAGHAGHGGSENG